MKGRKKLLLWVCALLFLCASALAQESFSLDGKLKATIAPLLQNLLTESQNLREQITASNELIQNLQKQIKSLKKQISESKESYQTLVAVSEEQKACLEKQKLQLENSNILLQEQNKLLTKSSTTLSSLRNYVTQLENDVAFYKKAFGICLGISGGIVITGIVVAIVLSN